MVVPSKSNDLTKDFKGLRQDRMFLLVSNLVCLASTKACEAFLRAIWNLLEMVYQCRCHTKVIVTSVLP